MNISRKQRLLETFVKDGSVFLHFSGNSVRNILGDVLSGYVAWIDYNHLSTLKEAILRMMLTHGKGKANTFIQKYRA